MNCIETANNSIYSSDNYDNIIPDNNIHQDSNEVQLMNDTLGVDNPMIKQHNSSNSHRSELKQWLLLTEPQSDPDYHPFYSEFLTAIEYGNIELVVDKIKEIKKLVHITGETVNGKVKIMKHNLNVHDSKDISYLFAECCINGLIIGAKCLYSVFKNINIHYNSDYAFIVSVFLEHTEIAKWLYDISKQSGKKIDVALCKRDHTAFEWCAVTGNLELGKWLYNIIYQDTGSYVEITDWMIKTSYDKKHYEYATWLEEKMKHRSKL
jgi:hypothetical protein